MTRRVFLIIALGLSVAGCQSPRRPPIRFGRDICAQCGMIISEARFAAAYITKQGQWRFFDDLGDMLVFYISHDEEVADSWVHDYELEDWLKAESAFFVTSSALHTPMGHGMVAVTSREHADRLADQTDGTVLTFAEALARFAQKS